MIGDREPEYQRFFGAALTVNPLEIGLWWLPLTQLYGYFKGGHHKEVGLHLSYYPFGYPMPFGPGEGRDRVHTRELSNAESHLQLFVYISKFGNYPGLENRLNVA
jgi:hypothetical protein